MVVRSRRIPVKNRDRAIAFYSALLGIDLKQQASALTFEENSQVVTTLLHFEVADRLEAALEVAWSKGGRILEPASPCDRRAIVMDCEGNRIALHAAPAAG